MVARIKKIKNKINYISVLYFIIGFLTMAFFVGPLLWVITTSVKSYAEISQYPPTIIPNTVTMRNYIEAIRASHLPRYFLNSVVITSLTVLFTQFFSTLAGFGFSRFKFPFKYVLMILLIAPRLIPSVTRVTPFYRIMSLFGILNTYTAVILAYIADTIPFSSLILLSFFDKVPRELDESAHINGASSFQVYYKICLPLVKPGIIVTVLWNFTRAWNEFVMANVLVTDTARRTLPAALYDFMGVHGFVDWGALMAFAVMAMAPVLVVFLGLQKYFVKGMMESGID